MTFFNHYDNINSMKEIVNKLLEKGYEAYIVGGYVRDRLLGIESKDIDICTNAPIENIIKIFKGRGVAYPKYFAYHIDENGYSYDITTYRKEFNYKKNKPTKLEIAPNLETDLLRRDFTINTLALKPNMRLVDLLDAKKDLDNKIIKTVGNTNRRFNEDKTRIIRAIRFACTLDFELDDHIITFIKRRKTYLLNEVPKEYIKKELDKIFDSDGYNRFFELCKKYKMTRYLSIKFKDVIKSYNRYGVWAQIETGLPLTKKERDTIEKINILLNKRDIEFKEFDLYNSDIILNAVKMLGLEDKYNAYTEFKSLRSIIDIDVDINLLTKYIGYSNIKKVYRKIERRIIEGKLDNNKKSIEMYLKEIRL